MRQLLQFDIIHIGLSTRESQIAINRLFREHIYFKEEATDVLRDGLDDEEATDVLRESYDDASTDILTAGASDDESTDVLAQTVADTFKMIKDIVVVHSNESI